MTNSQQLAAHCHDVIANPALYCILDPDGLPYMSELCVATDPGVLEDEVAAMNDGLEDGETRYSVQPLFFSIEPIEPIELPSCVDDLHGIGPVMSAAAVIEAIRAAGGSVKE